MSARNFTARLPRGVKLLCLAKLVFGPSPLNDYHEFFVGRSAIAALRRL